jgi:hypothetical protein
MPAERFLVNSPPPRDPAGVAETMRRLRAPVRDGFMAAG